MNFIIDIIINFLPKRLAKKISRYLFGDLYFCFLVHSRDYKDLYKRFIFLKFLPFWLVKIFGRYLFPVRVGYIDGLFYNNRKTFIKNKI